MNANLETFTFTHPKYSLPLSCRANWIRRLLLDYVSQIWRLFLELCFATKRSKWDFTGRDDKSIIAVQILSSRIRLGKLTREEITKKLPNNSRRTFNWYLDFT